MIYISESNTGKSSVTIRVEGTLNSESLPVFEEVYAKHAKVKDQIAVDFSGIMSVDRKAKAFLKSIKNAVRFVKMPAYLKLEIGVD